MIFKVLANTTKGPVHLELLRPFASEVLGPAHQYQNSSQYKILLVFAIFFSSFGLIENEPTKLKSSASFFSSKFWWFFFRNLLWLFVLHIYVLNAASFFSVSLPTKNGCESEAKMVKCYTVADLWKEFPNRMGFVFCFAFFLVEIIQDHRRAEDSNSRLQ